MKERKGFVSNSSSSSFVIIVQEDLHNEILNRLGPEHKSILEQLFGSKDAFGTKVYMLSDMTDMGGNSLLYYDAEEKGIIGDVFDASWEYRKMLNKEPDKTRYIIETCDM